MSKPALSGRLTTWAIELSEFDITYVGRTSIKAQALADFVNECSIHTPDDIYVPENIPGNEEFAKWELFVDGACNSKGSGAGIILRCADFQSEYALRFTFTATNNEAEYEAMIAGLQIARDMRLDNILVKADSKLVIDQVTGVAGVINESLAKYKAHVDLLSRAFHNIRFQHIPRAENSEADRMSQLATAYYEDLPGGVHVEIRKEPAYVPNTVLTVLEETPDWRTPIAQFLVNGVEPEDKVEAAKVRNRSLRFHMLEGELYRKSFDGPLLLCVSASNMSKVLSEIHEGWCGSHIGGRALALKIIRSGYYWPRLLKDSQEYVKKCDACQKFSTASQLPATTLTSIVTPVPFAMWGIDLVGKLPRTTGNAEYIIVAVDYFSKWVEAVPLSRIRGEDVVKFLWKNVVTRYGIPKILVTDNGTQFEGATLTDFCEKYGIEQRFAPVYYPQANGQVEVMNRIILQGLKKNVTQEGPQKSSWAEELPVILWSLRTTPSSVTNATPFSLVYGSEAVIPAEVGLPTYRQRGFDEQENSQRMLENLNFIDETRDAAFVKMQVYRQKLARAYNRRVRSRQFSVGDLVLRLFSASQPQRITKMSPKWEGPYRVRRILGPGTYELEDLEGSLIPRTWHVTNLRRYYV